MMRRAIIQLIQWYQAWSRCSLPASCRYWPSCSQYALEAVQRYGAVRGGYLAARRLLRCHPLGPGGLDLVPERPA